MARGAEFAALVHNVLVLDERYSLKDVAARCGMAYDALYARVANRTPFTADEIRTLLRCVPDVRLVAWLLDGTAFLPAARPATETMEAPFAESIRRSSIMMMVEAGEVARQIEEALADDRIDASEAWLIQAEIEAAERALATLREHVHRAGSGRRTG